MDKHSYEEKFEALGAIIALGKFYQKIITAVDADSGQQWSDAIWNCYIDLKKEYNEILET